VLFMDSEGTVRHWKYSGAYADQPQYDHGVYSEIRRAWVEKENERREKR